jgi:hypothetical protein
MHVSGVRFVEVLVYLLVLCVAEQQVLSTQHLIHFMVASMAETCSVT